jgi:hypothetical protein
MIRCASRLMFSEPFETTDLVPETVRLAALLEVGHEFVQAGCCGTHLGGHLRDVAAASGQKRLAGDEADHEPLPDEVRIQDGRGDGGHVVDE